jgi:hypothetical protein
MIHEPGDLPFLTTPLDLRGWGGVYRDGKRFMCLCGMYLLGVCDSAPINTFCPSERKVFFHFLTGQSVLEGDFIRFDG